MRDFVSQPLIENKTTAAYSSCLAVVEKDKAEKEHESDNKKENQISCSTKQGAVNKMMRSKAENQKGKMWLL